jgi:large conductance mechanosensitive channel
MPVRRLLAARRRVLWVTRSLKQAEINRRRAECHVWLGQRLPEVRAAGDFSNLFIVLSPGKAGEKEFASLQQATAAGATTINYGVFINNLIAFLIVALVMFWIIRVVNRVDAALEVQFGGDKPAPGEPENKKCPHCRMTIPFKATRCPQCTSQLEESAV